MANKLLALAVFAIAVVITIPWIRYLIDHYGWVSITNGTFDWDFTCALVVIVWLIGAIVALLIYKKNPFKL